MSDLPSCLVLAPHPSGGVAVPRLQRHANPFRFAARALLGTEDNPATIERIVIGDPADRIVCYCDEDGIAKGLPLMAFLPRLSIGGAPLSYAGMGLFQIRGGLVICREAPGDEGYDDLTYAELDAWIAILNAPSAGEACQRFARFRESGAAHVH